MSHLVTQAVPVAHSLGWPPARLAPGPHARGRGSSSGCGDWTASALDSPPCSPCGRPASSSTAGGAGCAGPGGTLARSSDTCVVFAWSSAGILQPPMMRTSTPDRDVGRRRAEEDEEALTGSFSKKTPPKKTAVSDRWNHYTFKPVLARRGDHRQAPHRARRAPAPACARRTLPRAHRRRRRAQVTSTNARPEGAQGLAVDLVTEAVTALDTRNNTASNQYVSGVWRFGARIHTALT